MNDSIFSVEHGPAGGDELNLISFNSNYGWPEVSYGTRYSYHNDGKSYSLSHEKKNFEEPLFALVPSVGISSLNTCPSKLIKYYKKNCLMATSLYGNSKNELYEDADGNIYISSDFDGIYRLSFTNFRY